MKTYTTARELLKGYEEIINQHSFDEVEPLLSADCTFWFTSGTHQGVQQARKAFEKTWGFIQNEVYTLTQVQWISESDSSAACTYTYNWKGLINGSLAEGNGRGTSVFRKEESGWKIIHEHLSAFPKV